MPAPAGAGNRTVHPARNIGRLPLGSREIFLLGYGSKAGTHTKRNARQGMKRHEQNFPGELGVITLYGMGSPNVRKILLMLEELEVPYRTQRLSVFEGEQFDPAFEAISPFNKVPVLVEDGAEGEAAQSICESGAILLYLAERFGRFLPTAGPERYAVMQWLLLQTSNIGPMFGQYIHFKLIGDAGKGYSRERYLTIAARAYEIVEQRLGQSPWLGGADYSIADIATYHWMMKPENYRVDRAHCPNLMRWCAAIAERPAARREAEAAVALTADDLKLVRDAPADQLERFFWRDRRPGGMMLP